MMTKNNKPVELWWIANKVIPRLKDFQTIFDLPYVTKLLFYHSNIFKVNHVSPAHEKLSKNKN